ncbi:hypothetical protein GCM10023084_56640 [Streptomyces lacrimifluminis]|uniref:Uncharacterized protein n=1 Tax=Streptomyces lacrimifluminis TaxID=1500077 RepID=A0A917LAD3_9ACTN|nr:hypothetical protein [Streptomyces lacrimifluminis]GGJ53604.1 hypothetical protein GCM10012282_58330 [Streptomyces lacrimifluminis]
MSGTAFRSGAERSYPLPHAGPGAQFTESLVTSVAALLVAYGFPRLDASADRAALEKALTAFLYNPLESHK